MKSDFEEEFKYLDKLLLYVSEILGKDTKRSLAKKLGVSESMAGLLMKGHRTWTPKYLKKLSSAYSLSSVEQNALHNYAARAAGYTMLV